MKSDALIELIDASVSINGKTILSDINWSLRPDENWMVRGHNGAGKTTFLKLAAGKLWPASNVGKRFYGINGRKTESPISFKQQVRFASLDQLDWYRLNNWNISAREVVCSGLFGSMLLHGRPEKRQTSKAEIFLDKLGLGDQAERGILTLSHGQAKRALLARALVSSPGILFLDEIYDGLDVFWKKRVSDELLVATENGTLLVWASNEYDCHFPAMTHSLELENGKIIRQGPLRGDLGSISHDFMEAAATRQSSFSGTDEDFVIKIEKADVFAGGNKVLHDIGWTVRPRENWMILGENGSGKTTLLKLVAGELSPAWGGSISRFGSNESGTLWEIRSRVSLVSTDLQVWHRCAQTGRELVLSGLFGSIGLHTNPAKDQVEAAAKLLESFGMQDLGEADVRRLSHGELKKLLIMRALITDPDVLLVDEPMVGLDMKSISALAGILNQAAARGKTLICATHRPEIIKDVAPNALELKHGKIAGRRLVAPLPCNYGEPH